jgi:hypothetical protein
MHSRKRLYEDLTQLKKDKALAVKLPDSYKNMNNEVYGKQACIYVCCETEGAKADTIHYLKKLGHKINEKYQATHMIEVQVSYFKGWHWDI